MAYLRHHIQIESLSIKTFHIKSYETEFFLLLDQFIRSGKLFHFTVEVSSTQKYTFNAKSPVAITHHMNVKYFVEQYKAIYNANESPLFKRVIIPSDLRNIDSSAITPCRLGIAERKRVSSSIISSLNE